MQNQGKIIKHSLWLQFSCNFTQTVTSKEIWANVVPVYGTENPPNMKTFNRRKRMKKWRFVLQQKVNRTETVSSNLVQEIVLTMLPRYTIFQYMPATCRYLQYRPKYI